MKKTSFEGLAPWYLLLETLSFGNYLQKCRISFISELKVVKSVLILGDGNGRFLESFLKSNLDAQIDYLDLSKKMITLAKSRVALIPNKTKVVFIQKDVFDWCFPINKYDLVVSNFFLDCFTFKELEHITNKISLSLKPGGELIYGDFNVPKSYFEKFYAIPLLAIMYLFFRITTSITAKKLIDPTIFLNKEGLNLTKEKYYLGSFLKSQLWIKA